MFFCQAHADRKYWSVFLQRRAFMDMMSANGIGWLFYATEVVWSGLRPARGLWFCGFTCVWIMLILCSLWQTESGESLRKRISWSFGPGGLWAAWISQLFKWGKRSKNLHLQCCDHCYILDLGEMTSLGATFLFCFRDISLMLRRHLWLVIIS